MKELTREEAQNSIVEPVKDGDEAKDSALKEASLEAVEIGGRKQFYQLQGRWSWWIIGWITALIAFNAGLTVAVGLKWVDFAGMEWFITAVTVETFLQVVGLGYVAAKYLFSKP